MFLLIFHTMDRLGVFNGLNKGRAGLGLSKYELHMGWALKVESDSIRFYYLKLL